MKTRHNPDKSIDAINTAGAMKAVEVSNLKMRLKGIITRVGIEISKALRGTRDNNPEQVADAKKALINQLLRYYEIINQIAALEKRETIEITHDDLLAAISTMTKIPVLQLKADERTRLANLEQLLENRVIGQAAAKKAVASAVRRARTLRTPGKPQGVILLVGPTGVGKTEIAKALSEILFGDEKGLVRLDMTEYQEPHSIAKLTGSPPGYVGYQEGGQLTGPVLERPYSIVLLDEAEKAHLNVLKEMMPAFDDARLTDGRGKTADFSNVLFLLTSNLAAKEMQTAVRKIREEGRRNGLSEEEIKAAVAAEREKIFNQAYEHDYPPEIRGRVQEVILFDDLTPAELREVLRLHLKKRIVQLEEMGFELRIDDKVEQFLLKVGVDPDLGCRPLITAITKHIIDPLASAIVDDTIPPRSIIQAKVVDDKLSFTPIGVREMAAFKLPQVEGKAGVLVYRVFSALENLAAQGKQGVTDDEVRELVSPQSERVDEALNKIVNAGLSPVGGETLESGDPKKKDPKVEKVAQNLGNMVKLAGFGPAASSAVDGYTRFLTAIAKSAPAQTGATLKLHWNFYAGTLEVSLRGPKIPAEQKQKLVANLITPRPASEEAVRLEYEKLQANGDLNLLNLKRQVLETGGSISFDDQREQTVFVMKLPLFTQEKRQSGEEAPQMLVPEEERKQLEILGSAGKWEERKTAAEALGRSRTKNAVVKEGLINSIKKEWGASKDDKGKSGRVAVAAMNALVQLEFSDEAVADVLCQAAGARDRYVGETAIYNLGRLGVANEKVMRTCDAGMGSGNAGVAFTAAEAWLLLGGEQNTKVIATLATACTASRFYDSKVCAEALPALGLKAGQIISALQRGLENNKKLVRDACRKALQTLAPEVLARESEVEILLEEETRPAPPAPKREHPLIESLLAGTLTAEQTLALRGVLLERRDLQEKVGQIAYDEGVSIDVRLKALTISSLVGKAPLERLWQKFLADRNINAEFASETFKYFLDLGGDYVFCARGIISAAANNLRESLAGNDLLMIDRYLMTWQGIENATPPNEAGLLALITRERAGIETELTEQSDRSIYSLIDARNVEAARTAAYDKQLILMALGITRKPVGANKLIEEMEKFLTGERTKPADHIIFGRMLDLLIERGDEEDKRAAVQLAWRLPPSTEKDQLQERVKRSIGEVPLAQMLVPQGYIGPGIPNSTVWSPDDKLAESYFNVGSITRFSTEGHKRDQFSRLKNLLSFKVVKGKIIFLFSFRKVKEANGKIDEVVGIAGHGTREMIRVETMNFIRQAIGSLEKAMPQAFSDYVDIVKAAVVRALKIGTKDEQEQTAQEIRELLKRVEAANVRCAREVACIRVLVGANKA